MNFDPDCRFSVTHVGRQISRYCTPRSAELDGYLLGVHSERAKRLRGWSGKPAIDGRAVTIGMSMRESCT